MKGLLLSAAMLCCLQPLSAQRKYLREFRNAYGSRAETHTVGAGMIPLRIAAAVIPARASEETAILKRMLKNVKRVKVYTISLTNGLQIDTAAVSRLRNTLREKSAMEDLIEVRDKHSLVYVMNHGTNDEIGNMVMLIQEESEFMMVHLNTTLKIADMNVFLRHFIYENKDRKKKCVAEDSTATTVTAL